MTRGVSGGVKGRGLASDASRERERCAGLLSEVETDWTDTEGLCCEEGVLLRGPEGRRWDSEPMLRR